MKLQEIRERLDASGMTLTLPQLEEMLTNLRALQTNGKERISYLNENPQARRKRARRFEHEEWFPEAKVSTFGYLASIELTIAQVQELIKSKTVVVYEKPE